MGIQSRTHPFSSQDAAVGVCREDSRLTTKNGEKIAVKFKETLSKERGPLHRITYGAREKSVMHAHLDTVAVFLIGNRAKFTFPDGKTEERSWKAGETMFIPAEEHMPENLTDKSIKLILIELKD